MKSIRWIMANQCAITLSLLALAFPASAGDWALRLQQWQDAGTRLPGAAPRDTERRALGLAWSMAHERGRTGVSYLYQPVLIRTGDPGTNGHLHQLDVEYVTMLGDTRLGAALGLHGSSNIFTHGEFRSEVLTGRFDVSHELSDKVRAGLAGDYRFGQFLVYPRLHATVALDGSELVFDLPVGVYWRAPNGDWSVGVERYGDKWATLDTRETVEGKFYLSEWQFTGELRLGRFRGTTATLGAGLSFDTEARYLDLERGFVETEPDAAAFAFLTLTR